jgi:PKD repeat protein
MPSRYERSLGTAVLALGVGLLLFGFYQAYVDLEHLPNDQGPTAQFTWSETGLKANFADTSSVAGGTITTVYWSFGDGNSSSAVDPTHTYAASGTYNVTLMVQSSDGLSAETVAVLDVYPAATGSGGSSPSEAIGGGNGIGSFLSPIFGGVSGLFKTSETFVFLGIEYLVGAAILRAGWNLITPKAETIQVRVKPRDLQVEPVESASPSPAGVGMGAGAPLAQPSAVPSAAASPASP